MATQRSKKLLVNPGVLVQKALTHLGKAALLFDSDFLWRLGLSLSAAVLGLVHVIVGFLGTAADDIDYWDDDRAALSLLVQEVRYVIFELGFEAV